MSLVYKLNVDDNVFIFTDGSNHDDFITILMAIKTLKNLKGIIICGGAFGHPGPSLTIYTNFLRKFCRTDVKVYIGPMTSLFDLENQYLDTFSKQVSKKTLFYIDQLFGANYLIPNYGPNEINEDYEQDILKTESPVLLCLGNTTGMVNVLNHAKFIYVMGGRFNPEDIHELQPPSNVKKNRFASSNIYADPIAAQLVLEHAGHKTAWLFSSSAQSINVDEETLILLQEITNCGNECSLEIVKLMYRNMIDAQEAYPVSDASLLILAFHPDLFTDVRKERIIINTGVNLDINVNHVNATVTDTVTFSLGIGGMEKKNDGFSTILVEGPKEKEIVGEFLKIMCLDDYVYAVSDKSEDEDNCECECECDYECKCEHCC